VGGTAWLSHRGAAPDADAAGETGTLPAPKDGYRWVSWRNVAVQVPMDWGYGFDPGDQWCVGDDGSGASKDTPFFTFHQVNAAQTLVACVQSSDAPKVFGPAPEDHWVTHLTMQEPDEYAGTTATFDGWTVSSQVVDGVEVRALGKDAEEVRAILASAHTFQVDQNGCAPTAGVQAGKFPRPDPAYDVTEIEAVDSISVCQYARGPGRTLMASRRVQGDAAEALLRGLKQAPEGTGPDRPQNCMPDDYGEEALELVLHSGEDARSVYLYYSTCFGNGTDDGVHHRMLTAATCAPSFTAPVIAWGYQSNLDKLCSNRR
jgi:hypothetical protein